MQENKDLKERIQELERENHDLLQTKADEIRLLQQDLVTKSSEIATLQKENQELRERIQELERRNADLAKGNTDLAKKLEIVQRDLADLKAESESRARQRADKHSLLLQRSLVYSLLHKLKLYFKLKKKEEPSSIEELYEIVQENGHEESWKTFLKRCGLSHQQMLKLDMFCERSRRAAFMIAHPTCVHPTCLSRYNEKCYSAKDEIQKFLTTTITNQKTQVFALQMLDVLSTLIELLGLQKDSLLTL